MSQPELRRRVVRWDSQTPPEPSMSGLESLQALASGERPPPAASLLIGTRLVSVEPGRVRMSLRPAEYHYNPLGGVHGGIIATLLDTLMACAVWSMLPAGRTCTTLEIKVNYLRGLTEATGEVMGEGVAIHTGRQVGVSEARITGADGRLYATASSTLLVFDVAAGARPADRDAGEHVVEWSDPREVASAARGMPGIDFLRAAKEGRLPRAPFAALLGIGFADVSAGRVAMTLPPGGHLNNPGGTMHGGMMATLLDSVMGCAVHSVIPAGQSYTTLELKVNYLRAVTAASGLITGNGQVVHAGRQVAVAEGRATDAAGRLCATASTTCLVFAPPSSSIP